MKSNWVRAGAVGVVLVSSAAGVAAFAALGGAQTVGTSPIVFAAGADSAPAVSDLGSVVVFQSDTLDGGGVVTGSSIALYDRSDPDAPVAPVPLADSVDGVRPGISGNGCIVAWSTDAVDPVPDPAPERILAVDRCADPAIALTMPTVAEVDAADELAAPALSLDGTILAVSTGQEIVVLDRSGTAFSLVDVVDGLDPVDATDPHVDVSDDGSVVVFSAGPVGDPADRDVFQFATDADPTVAPTVLVADAFHPDLSGDASVLTAVQNDPVDGDQVIVTPLPLDGPVDVLAGGTRPVISDDGNHIVFDTVDGVSIHSWIGSGVRPFAAVDDRTLPDVAVTRSGPAVDRYGTVLATDAPFTEGEAETDLELTVEETDTRFGADSYDLGVGDIDDELRTTVDLINDGPASFAIDTISVEGTFVVEPDACTGVLRPGTSCSFDVSFMVAAYEDAVADLSVTGLVPGTGPVVTQVEALGQPPATTTTTIAPTSTAGTTTSSTTTTTTTAGTTTGGSTTGGSTTGSTSTSGGSSGTSTTRGTTTSTTRGTTTTTSTTTTTTLPAGSGVVISPASFAFAPTIIDSGRRTGAVEVVNSASAAATIDLSTLRGDASFTIAADGCGSVVLGEGERCTITIDFAPTAEGEVSAELGVLVGGGRELTATLTGTGARTPELSVVPESAQAGQVVTVRGSGFPVGVTVHIEVEGSAVTAEVDAAGAFAQPIVIMSNTPGGPLEVTVVGQQDLYGDVSTDVLVRASGDRAGPSPIDGPGINVGR